MIVNQTIRYFRTPFDSEAEIEQVVKDYANYLFGSSIIFLPKAKISTLGGAGTIPDGFVIDIASKDWFIVEAELGYHGTWQHIAPQISKQLAAADSPSTRQALLRIALDMVKSDQKLQDAFTDQGISQFDTHGTLDAILKKPPVIAIPIDTIPQDLRSWAKTLKFDVKIWVIEKYASLDRSTIVYSIPDENIPTVTTTTSHGQTKSTVAVRWSQPYQDVLDAGLLQEGQRVLLDYGPRGQAKQTFEGTIRKEGVEIEGKVMSLSTAAVYCIQKAGSDRETANGWIMWKTEDGRYLNDFYNQVSQTNGDEDAQPEDGQVSSESAPSASSEEPSS